MSLTVLSAGLYSLRVDAGRRRSRALGVPVSGPADAMAFNIANALVGNEQTAPALEITLAGPTLKADDETFAVIVGAAFAISINHEQTIEAGTTFYLKAGDMLRVGGCAKGARGYLAVRGGFRGPKILNSYCALEPLQVHDVLECDASMQAGLNRSYGRYEWESEEPIRVLPGPQWDWFKNPEQFTTEEYTVTPTSNRMGLRLQGRPLERKPAELASEPVAPGAVQVTNDGMPVVLGVDGQTIGGYPKIAHVIRADLDRLGRLRPGDKIAFRLVDEAEAMAAATSRSQALHEAIVRIQTMLG